MNPTKNQASQLLNNLTPSQFLAEYWQKKPLLIKNAIPNFTGLLSPEDLAGLACEEDVQARIVQKKSDKWLVKNGPFNDADFAKLPNKDWTLLVQSVNHYLPEATELLNQFDFIPKARLDDLMVSYAPNGGGVGAHVDSYDVFLLQGSGKRRWKISSQTDLSLIEDAPLKILKNFVSEQEWILEAGDMLYLPPQIAHWGVAVGDHCMTYSIGFRAPKQDELIHEFLSYLQDDLTLKNTQNILYSDPDLQLQNHPAEISDAMIQQVKSMLEKIHWDNNHVADFLGKYLTEPKLDVYFEPAKKLSMPKFIAQLQQKSIVLDLKSQMLFTHNGFYLNGEKLTIPDNLMSFIQDLANQRCLDISNQTTDVQNQLADVLYDSYLAGFIRFE
ncbi:MAG: cupin [Proteobacteria bacterium ST_bin12]|nr:MAG: cupin [Proteobacteria bacterium ST_bin12]